MQSKLYVSLLDGTVNAGTRPVYLEQMRQAGVDRLLFAPSRDLLFPGDHAEEYREVEESLRYFQQNGLTVGIWVQAFGFGVPLTAQQQKATEGFTHITSVIGNNWGDAFCPEDEGFTAMYCDMVRKIAGMHPDFLLLDDDLCLSVRPGIGCFCPRHRALLEKELGEALPEDFAQLAFAGGENKYRSVWLNVMGDTLRRFCRRVREAIDEVDPSVRAGYCSGFTSWDMEGADALELTKLLAGNTKPLLRLSGAPYWVANGLNRFAGQKLHGIIEFCRAQVDWCRGEDVELFTEGDVYPRPRYTVPNAWLDCYDAALRASGGTDSFKYLFDYVSSPEYETGYLKRHLKNLPLYEYIDGHFTDKQTVGVRVYEKMLKTRTMRFPQQFTTESRFMETALLPAPAMLSALGIPTAYGEESEVGIAFGNGADEITALPKKLILDAEAAWLLQQRGVDTGLRSQPVYQAATPMEEHFASERILLTGSHGRYCTCDLAEGVQIESTFLQDEETPATYTYHSGNTEFLVLLWDGYSVRQDSSVYCSYARQHQLLAFCPGFPSVADCPGVYQLCKQADGETVSLFVNICEDAMFDFDIRIPQPFTDFELFNAEGVRTADGIRVSSTVPAFGAFALRLR